MAIRPAVVDDRWHRPLGTFGQAEPIHDDGCRVLLQEQPLRSQVFGHPRIPYSGTVAEAPHPTAVAQVVGAKLKRGEIARRVGVQADDGHPHPQEHEEHEEEHVGALARLDVLDVS